MDIQYKKVRKCVVWTSELLLNAQNFFVVGKNGLSIFIVIKAMRFFFSEMFLCAGGGGKLNLLPYDEQHLLYAGDLS